jgi:hypothetical protein
MLHYRNVPIELKRRLFETNVRHYTGTRKRELENTNLFEDSQKIATHPPAEDSIQEKKKFEYYGLCCYRTVVKVFKLVLGKAA